MGSQRPTVDKIAEDIRAGKYNLNTFGGHLQIRKDFRECWPGSPTLSNLPLAVSAMRERGIQERTIAEISWAWMW